MYNFGKTSERKGIMYTLYTECVKVRKLDVWDKRFGHVEDPFCFLVPTVALGQCLVRKKQCGHTTTGIHL